MFRRTGIQSAVYRQHIETSELYHTFQYASRENGTKVFIAIQSFSSGFYQFPLFCSPSDSNYVIDHFEKTRPMSTFTFGFVISQLSEVNRTYHTELEKPILKIYGRKDFHSEISVKARRHKNLQSFLRKSSSLTVRKITKKRTKKFKVGSILSWRRQHSHRTSRLFD